jgi:hypothetical protein
MGGAKWLENTCMHFPAFALAFFYSLTSGCRCLTLLISWLRAERSRMRKDCTSHQTQSTYAQYNDHKSMCAYHYTVKAVSYTVPSRSVPYPSPIPNPCQIPDPNKKIRRNIYLPNPPRIRLPPAIPPSSRLYIGLGRQTPTLALHTHNHLRRNSKVIGKKLCGESCNKQQRSQKNSSAREKASKNYVAQRETPRYACRRP